MAYFYYVMRTGKPSPRIDSIHPKDRINPETPIGPVIELKSPEDTFCIESLCVIYPLKGQINDQR